jgi:hypothetical protein
MFERIGRPVAAVQAGEAERVRPGRALVVEVVDGENSARVAERIVPAQAGLEVQRQQRGVPVVAVQDVGPDVEQLARADDGPAEEGVAQEKVIAIGTGRVDLVALEEVVVGDEVHRHVRARERGAQEGGLGGPVGPGDGDGGQHLVHVRAVALQPVPGLPVEGHEDHDVVSECLQRFRQRGADVAQAAGLGDGRNLGGGEEDFHGAPLLYAISTAP